MRIGLRDKHRIGLVFDFAGKRGVEPRFLAFWDFAFERFVIPWQRVIDIGKGDEQTAGRSPEGPAASGAGSNHRHEPSAGAVGSADRLEGPGWALQFGGPSRVGAAWPADAACRRPVHFEAHAQPVR